MRIFRDMDLVEQLGSGVPRILQAYGKECFYFSDNFIKTFPQSEDKCETHVASLDTILLRELRKITR
jgi:predicted HTH transcriptional regulator